MNPTPQPSLFTYPFVIEHRLVPSAEKASRLRPEARLFVTEALRTSGLLASLPDREVKNLLWLLTYLHPNGRILAPLNLIARDMGLSEREVRKQLLVLATTYWRSHPIVQHLTEDTLERFTLSSPLLGEETLEASLNLPIPEPLYTAVSREEVVATSREKYSRPREEVEKIVMAQLDHHPEEMADTPEGEVRRGLMRLSISREQISQLIEEFGVVACLRQLEWLPLRAAKNPSRYIVAAIQDNYSPPRGARLPDLELEIVAAAEASEEAVALEGGSDV